MFAMPHGPAGTGKAESEQALLGEAMERCPWLLDPGWIWLMDRNYHGAPRIARMIAFTHVLIRLKSDIPLRKTSPILPDGSYRAELSGDGTTIAVRVIEYWVTVEGQDVPEMFCLVTDLLDYEDYPGPELAALYKWRWDGSETALREAKATLHGAGPGTGPMPRSGTPPLIRQELAAWAAATAMTRAVIRDAALAATPARKGRRAGLAVRPPRPVPCPRRPRHPSRDPPRQHPIPGRDQRDRPIPERRRPRPAPRQEVEVTQRLRARQPGRQGHPNRLRRRHHGQHASLTSGNAARMTERRHRRPVGPAAPARHAGPWHAHRKETTHSNQKQELPTNGQTPKAHGIGAYPLRRTRGAGCHERTSAVNSPRCRHDRDHRSAIPGRPKGGRSSG
jgi:hypothetical protein